MLLEGISNKLPANINLPEDMNKADHVLQDSYRAARMDTSMQILLREYGFQMSEEEWEGCKNGFMRYTIPAASSFERTSGVLKIIDDLRKDGFNDGDIKKIFRVDDKVFEFKCISPEAWLKMVRQGKKQGVSLDDIIMFAPDLFPESSESEEAISGAVARMKMIRTIGWEKPMDMKLLLNAHNKYSIEDTVKIGTEIKKLGTAKDAFEMFFNPHGLFIQDGSFGDPPSIDLVLKVIGDRMKEGAPTPEEALWEYDSIGGILEKTQFDEKDPVKVKKEVTELRRYYYAQSNTARIFIKEMGKRTISTDVINIKKFMSDKALPLAIKVYELAYKNDPPAKGVEMSLMVGRNLYFEGNDQVLTKEIIDAKVKEIEKIRAEIDNIDLFRNRNVVLVSNDEQGEDGKPRFDMPGIREGLRESVEGGTLECEVLREKERNPKGIIAFKKRVLERLVKTPIPLTYFFNGHGGDMGQYFTDQRRKNEKPFKEADVMFSVEEIAKVLSDRAKKNPGKENELARDIFIFSECYSPDFIRNAYRRSRELGGVHPISLGESEFGQYGFGSRKKTNSRAEETKSAFEEVGKIIKNPETLVDVISEHFEESKEEALYGIGKKGWKVKDFRMAEADNTDSNLSVFATSIGGILRQVGKNQTETPKNEGSSNKAS